MKPLILKLGTALLLASTCMSATQALTLKSNDIAHGEFMSNKHEFKGFGCTGDNLSPQLSWSDVPEGTESFALLVHDPDAPTGSGWWHWQVVNIGKDVRELIQDAGNIDGKKLPKDSMQIESDYGSAAFGGACPPPGHGAHRYRFTLHALSTKLDLPQNASGALVGYMVNANSIASSTIETLYKR